MQKLSEGIQKLQHEIHSYIYNVVGMRGMEPPKLQVSAIGAKWVWFKGPHFFYSRRFSNGTALRKYYGVGYDILTSEVKNHFQSILHGNGLLFLCHVIIKRNTYTIFWFLLNDLYYEVKQVVNNPKFS